MPSTFYTLPGQTPGVETKGQKVVRWLTPHRAQVGLAVGVAALAGGLAEMLGNAELRHRLAQRAPEVLERFSLQRVLEMWDQVLEQVYCQVRGA